MKFSKKINLISKEQNVFSRYADVQEISLIIKTWSEGEKILSIKKTNDVWCFYSCCHQKKKKNSGADERWVNETEQGQKFRVSERLIQRMLQR